MSKRTIISVTLLFLLALVGTAFILFHSPEFTGSRVANPDSYTLDAKRMHGSDRHTMELKAGDVLEIQFEAQQGKLYVAIEASDGALLYSGNGETVNVFAVKIPRDDTYSIAVEARHARGYLHIQRAENK